MIRAIFNAVFFVIQHNKKHCPNKGSFTYFLPLFVKTSFMKANLLFQSIYSIKVRVFFYAFCLLFEAYFTSSALAQSLVLSKPQRIANKVSEYEIAGKTDQGVVLFKWGNNYNVVELYDERNLALIWSKEIQFDGRFKPQVRKLLAFKNDILVFYTLKKKRTYYLYVRQTDTNMQPTNARDLLLDSLQTSFASPLIGTDFAFSQNKAYLNVVFFAHEMNHIRHAKSILLNRNLETLSYRTIEVQGKEMLLQNMVGNAGETIVAFADTRRTLLSNLPRYEYLRVETYDYKSRRTTQINIPNSDDHIGSLLFDIDNGNKQLVAAGFYTEQRNSRSIGFFYGKTAIGDTSIALRYVTFDTDLLQQVNSNSVSTNGELFNLRLQQLLVRQDGGALLIGESVHTTQQNTYRSAFDNFSRIPTPSTDYFYEDMVIISVHPSGQTYWAKAVQKKQFSEDDNAYYSSFAILNQKAGLRLIFNDEIRFNSKLSNCTVAANGEHLMSSLNNYGTAQNMLLAPRYAKQLWADATLVPAFTSRNELVLVKILF